MKINDFQWSSKHPNKEGLWLYRLCDDLPYAVCFIEKRRYIDGILSDGLRIRDYIDPDNINGHLCRATGNRDVVNVECGYWAGPIIEK